MPTESTAPVMGEEDLTATFPLQPLDVVASPMLPGRSTLAKTCAEAALYENIWRRRVRRFWQGAPIVAWGVDDSATLS